MPTPVAITGTNLSKAFDDNTVLNELTLHLKSGERYVLSAPSGTGKTTLLRLLAGLDRPDSGTLVNTNSVSMVFQDARVFEQHSSVDNLRLVVGATTPEAAIRSTLACLLPVDSIDLPISQLSGGMRRRVELCRALLAPSQLLLLDEPFAGLDMANSAMAQELILSLLSDRTIVIVSHDQEDVELLNLKPLSLKASR